MTRDEFNALLRRPALAKRNPAICSEGTSAVMECAVGDGPLAAPQAQASDSGRYLVRVVSYRTRLLDEDNLAEKYHVDACRYAGLIPTDSPDRTTIHVSQEKVKTKAEERTEIMIQLEAISNG